MSPSLLLFLLAGAAVAIASATGRPPGSSPRADPMAARVVTAKNYQKPSPAYYAFSTDFAAGTLRVATSDDQDNWSEWSSIPNHGTAKVASNPVAVSQLVNPSPNPYIIVFCQDSDGQVVMYSQTQDFEALPFSTQLPKTLDVSNFSMDAVQAISLKNRTHVFARVQTEQPFLYWAFFDKSFNLSSYQWVRIGDDKTHLQFDPFVSVNHFVNRLEVFIVSGDYVKHLWQTSDTSFTGSWKKLGTDFSPKFNSAPVAHPMSHSVFNGVINVFVRGQSDSRVHHISQTTCDKVTNPWGPCTWGTFDSLVDTVPADPRNPNPFSIINNIHLGIEVFVVGATDGHLYHVWQKERDKVWRGWDDLGPLNQGSPFKGQPGLMLDEHGWWQAFALNSSGLVSRYVQSPLKFSLSSGAVQYGKNVTVSWAIPEDEATHMDWIGLYQVGTPDKTYLDFSYVGGSQNPLKDPVPQGAINFTVTLPAGKYDFRYLVNREYDAVLETTLSIQGSSPDEEWEQVFKGIAKGLGNLNTVNITECVDDGEKTVETFKAAFDAFEDRKIFEGMKLLSEGLGDFRDALVKCDEDKIVKDLTKFIEDLASCTENACSKFLIDLAEELVILYEHIYEIYGDIQAATNCFHVDAYEQGGISIGRVTWACLTLE